ncbi:MAG: hypothetical protein PHF19_06955 [Synergistales bacterium]|jgi:hypothetical protein|nr:hypothetical protein [Synergistales bacterium]
MQALKNAEKEKRKGRSDLLSLVRTTARVIYLKCADVRPVEAFLQSRVAARSFNPGFDQRGFDETSTLIFLEHQKPRERLVVIQGAPDEILAEVVNGGMAPLICRIDLAPGTLLMRLTGKIEMALKRIKAEFNAREIIPDFLLPPSEREETALFFTRRPLNQSLGLDELYPLGLMLPGERNALFPLLRERAQEYLEEALDGQKWTEAEVRIYDVYGHYDVQVNRFLIAFRDLELGIVVEEGWGKDYPLAMMAIPIYKLRLFTPFSKGEIKRLAMGLEFHPDGTRLADIDVFENGVRLNWSDFKGKGSLSTRPELIAHLRRELHGRLSKKALDQILALEEEARRLIPSNALRPTED